jgi:hypothetical protein
LNRPFILLCALCVLVHPQIAAAQTPPAPTATATIVPSHEPVKPFCCAPRPHKPSAHPTAHAGKPAIKKFASPSPKASPRPKVSPLPTPPVFHTPQAEPEIVAPHS